MSRKRRSTQLSQTQDISQDGNNLTLEFSQSQSDSTKDEKVNNLVRYLVINAGKNICFRRADLAKVVGSKTGPTFQEIISQTTKILREVYGYNLLVVDPDHSKTFILSNYMPYKDYSIESSQDAPIADNQNDDDSDQETIPENQPKDSKNILLLLILSHVFMSGGSVSETSLKCFLKPLSITHERRHPIFGDIKQCIDSLIKMKYLAVETDPVTKVLTYSWGVRAEKEIKKMDVLQFVCKMYGNKRPENFVDHMKEAKAQTHENSAFFNETAGPSMEIDETDE